MKNLLLLSVLSLSLCVTVISGCSRPNNNGEDTVMDDSGNSIATQQNWGTSPSGEPVDLFTLSNKNGYSVQVIEFGAILHSIKMPDKNGNVVDIVLGCDSVDCYDTLSPFFGATVGRYANRIGKGTFTLDDTEYSLAINDDPNHLHGGEGGFNRVDWVGEAFAEPGEAGVRLTYTSADGEEGYPGELENSIVYTLNDDNELTIYFESTTNKPTVVNLTNHAYYNLAGHDAGTIHDHELMIAASNYTPTDSTLIPTGEIATVSGTPLDFTESKAIGRDIDQIPAELGGYDHNFVLDHGGKGLAFAARVKDPASGRVMEVWNDQPGLQFYTGIHIPNTFAGKDGFTYQKASGFCLESQKFPDSPNKPNFASPVLRPGETYTHTIVMKFSAE